MTDGEPETAVSASQQKIKSIKNPIFIILFFYLIKSETIDSFVNHFDGHFCRLKNLGNITLLWKYPALGSVCECVCMWGAVSFYFIGF